MANVEHGISSCRRIARVRCKQMSGFENTGLAPVSPGYPTSPDAFPWSCCMLTLTSVHEEHRHHMQSPRTHLPSPKAGCRQLALLASQRHCCLPRPRLSITLPTPKSCKLKVGASGFGCKVFCECVTLRARFGSWSWWWRSRWVWPRVLSWCGGCTGSGRCRHPGPGPVDERRIERAR